MYAIHSFIKIPVILTALQLDFMSKWLYLLHVSIFLKQLKSIDFKHSVSLNKHGSIFRFPNMKSTVMRKLNLIIFVKNGTYLDLLYNNSLGLLCFINISFI